MGLADDDLKRRVREFQAHLNGLGAAGRRDFVDAARRNEDWPEPREAYLRSHAKKWGRGLGPVAYAQLAYEIKSRPGVLVLAYIHPIKRNRGLAFVDAERDFVVLFDTDRNLNFDVFSPTNGARPWVKDKSSAGTHWRVRDTEL